MKVRGRVIAVVDVNSDAAKKLRYARHGLFSFSTLLKQLNSQDREWFPKWLKGSYAIHIFASSRDGLLVVSQKLFEQRASSLSSSRSLRLCDLCV